MKKKQLNGIRQLAEQLPLSKEIQKYSTVVQGYELTEQELDGTDINIEAEKFYVKSGNYRIVDINHFNRLKKAFARSREQGLIDYIEWVDRNNKNMNAIFEKMKLQRVSDELLTVAKKRYE